MPARRKTDPATDPGPSFEECLAGLEEIVEVMENDQLPLEELVARYETGTGLLRRCETMLATARERIELITLRSQSGGPEDLSSGSSDSPSPAPDDEPDDDIRLF